MAYDMLYSEALSMYNAVNELYKPRGINYKEFEPTHISKDPIIKVLSQTGLEPRSLRRPGRVSNPIQPTIIFLHYVAAALMSLPAHTT